MLNLPPQTPSREPFASIKKMLDNYSIGILGLIVTIIGSAVTIAALFYSFRIEKKRRKEELLRQQRFSWENIYEGIRQVLKWLKNDQFEPDIILSFPASSLIISSIAQLELNNKSDIIIVKQLNKNANSLIYESYYEVSTEKWTYFLSPEIFLDIKKKILILTDFSQTGITLKTLKNSLIKNGIQEENIKTASLVCVKGVGLLNAIPDYVWIWVDTFNVFMPWGHISRTLREKGTKLF